MHGWGFGLGIWIRDLGNCDGWVGIGKGMDVEWVDVGWD